MHEERTYRKLMRPDGLASFTVIENESDLHISAESNLEQNARLALLEIRSQLCGYISCHPEFGSSLVPVRVASSAPLIIQKMAQAASIANVGPMASVAGAVAEFVGKSLLKNSDEVIVENGGDLFIKCKDAKKVLVHAGDSAFSEKLSIVLQPSDYPTGVCTSSGKIGHSLSFGKADAVVALSRNTCLADAAATAVANKVKCTQDIESALSWGMDLPGISGLLIIIDDKLGASGNISLYRP
ncbi:MAG: hypothetical protein C0604_02770 [Clostridiales bacterium]|nr:MAG: hypothetical protein C0604_02770 [Clostridiales bacterium]